MRLSLDAQQQTKNIMGLIVLSLTIIALGGTAFGFERGKRLIERSGELDA